MWVRRIAGVPGTVQRLGTAEALRLPLQAPTPRPEGRLDALLRGRSGCLVVPARGGRIYADDFTDWIRFWAWIVRFRPFMLG